MVWRIFSTRWKSQRRSGPGFNSPHLHFNFSFCAFWALVFFLFIASTYDSERKRRPWQARLFLCVLMLGKKPGYSQGFLSVVTRLETWLPNQPSRTTLCAYWIFLEFVRSSRVLVRTHTTRTKSSALASGPEVKSRQFEFTALHTAYEDERLIEMSGKVRKHTFDKCILCETLWWLGLLRHDAIGISQSITRSRPSKTVSSEQSTAGTWTSFSRYNPVDVVLHWSLKLRMLVYVGQVPCISSERSRSSESTRHYQYGD